MKKVLVTNDDGINARGIKALVEALAPLADVYVAAPANEQSAKSQSISFLHPIKVTEQDMKGAVAAFAVGGTPADCVIWGLGMMKREGITPDYVISGINLGYNTGLAVYYSGTVAAAREGSLNGIKSIALSAGHHDAAEFEYILGSLPMLMDMAGRLNPGVILNVNAPDLPASEIKGYRILESAPFDYGVSFFFEDKDDGFFQLSGEPARIGDVIKYDFDAVEAGYMAISPLPTSMTDRVSLSRLKNAYADDRILTVIVDAQEDVVEEIEDKGRFEEKISMLARSIDRLGLPMLVTVNFGKGQLISGVREYTSRTETVERLEPNAWSAEDMTGLVSLIDADRIIIAGAMTHIALLQTALGFADRGYDVTVIEDCTASADIKEHKAAIAQLKAAGCHITTCETEIMKLAGERESYVRESVERILKLR